MRTEEEINEQVSIAIDIEATEHASEVNLARATGIREALDWVVEQQDQPPFEDE